MRAEVPRPPQVVQGLFEKRFRSSLNAYLNGYQTPPADFARRVTAALDTLEQAELAADTARQKVLKRAPKELAGAP